MENTEKNVKIPGECCPKKIVAMCVICLICLAVMLYLFQCKNTANGQNQTSYTISSPPPQFSLGLVSEEYIQDEISYIPRFVQDKKVITIALSTGDSIILFTPSDKMSDVEYNKWLGRSKAAYEYATGKVK